MLDCRGFSFCSEMLSSIRFHFDFWNFRFNFRFDLSAFKVSAFIV